MADPDDARQQDQDAQSAEGDMYQRDSGTKQEGGEDMPQEKQE